MTQSSKQRCRRSIFLALTALCCVEEASAVPPRQCVVSPLVSNTPRLGVLQARSTTMTTTMDLLLSWRGGSSTTDEITTSKKKSKKTTKKATTVVEEEEEEADEEAEAEEAVEVEEEEEDEENDEDEADDEADEVDSAPSSSNGKNAINLAMKEKDAAEALGDAIRDRADTLRDEDLFLQTIDWSVGSLGQAMGASDRIRREGGGVQASPSSVIANYFLKSHGGAHAVQCAFSFLATISGLGAIALSANSKPAIGLTYTMLQRTFLFAMIKHVSGMLAAASVAAKAIPKIGLSQARQWMEQLVTDPVSQYVFFNALMLLWLPPKPRVVEGACWWWGKTGIFPMMLGPILIREVISTMLVISDVLVLWSVGGKDESSSSSSSNGIETVLKISQSVINAIMSLLVTPGVWRTADLAQRQAILSKLVGRVSLVLEVAIGVLLLLDAAVGLFGAAFMSGAKRPPFRESLIRMVCVRLYIHFLWVRKSQIKKVALKMRGGASKLPFYILDILSEPTKALGLERENRPTDIDDMAWYDKLAVGLGFAE